MPVRRGLKSKNESGERPHDRQQREDRDVDRAPGVSVAATKRLCAPSRPPSHRRRRTGSVVVRAAVSIARLPSRTSRSPRAPSWRASRRPHAALQALQQVRVRDVVPDQVAVGQVAHVLRRSAAPRRTARSAGTPRRVASRAAPSPFACSAGRLPDVRLNAAACSGSSVANAMKSQAAARLGRVLRHRQPPPAVGHERRAIPS